MIAIHAMNKYESEKCVRFSPICYVKTTISINDMTDEEIANTWIQEEEEYQIRTQCRELIAYADAHSSSSSNCYYRYCLRGLESHTKYGKIRKEMHRYESKMLVMNEQDQQYLDENVDEEKIASVYQEISQQCQFHAECMAKKDRRDVERYYDKHQNDESTTINNTGTPPITTTIHSSTSSIICSRTIASAA